MLLDIALDLIDASVGPTSREGAGSTHSQWADDPSIIDSQEGTNGNRSEERI
jgi:hypothetical protein